MNTKEKDFNIYYHDRDDPSTKSPTSCWIIPAINSSTAEKKFVKMFPEYKIDKITEKRK